MVNFVQNERLSSLAIPKPISVGLLSSVIGLVMTVIGMATYSLTKISIVDTASNRSVFSGEDFQTVTGASSSISDKLRVELPADGRAVLSARATLDAKSYDIVSVRSTKRPPDSYLYFFWRTSESGKRIFRRSIPWSPSLAPAIAVHSDPEWQGTITEIGLDIYGGGQDGEIHMESVSLKSHGVLSELELSIRDWLALKPWSQQSINTIRFTSLQERIEPSIVFGAWTFFSILAAIIFCKHQGCRVRTALVLPILLPWIASDFLWQHRLIQQSLLTKTESNVGQGKLAGLVGRDKALMQYAVHLKNRVLNQPGSRIFLFHDSDNGDGHVYDRLRLQYFLLPHNIFNFWRYPNENHIESGEVLIFLGDIPGLEYDANTRRLKWRSGELANISLTDSHPMGTTYTYKGD